MPLYFFSVGTGQMAVISEGREFPNDDAALREANLIHHDLSRNQGASRRLEVTVSDKSGRTIARVRTGAQRKS